MPDAARYEPRRYPGGPDPLQWGLWDTRTQSFVAFFSFASKTAAEAAADAYNRHCPAERAA